MALPDIKKYELIDLLLIETWPEKAQAEVIAKFKTALAGFLNEKLSQSIDPALDAKFQATINDPQITPEKLEDFYNTNLPDLKEQITNLTLDFKRLFVIKVYQAKTTELKNNLASLEKDKDAKDEAKKTIHQDLITSLNTWESVLDAAKNDDWDKVKLLLQTISH